VIRLDTRPTTEEHGGLTWDQQLAEPEVKSGIMLPQKLSELRWKLAHKAKQEPGNVGVSAPSALSLRTFRRLCARLLFGAHLTSVRIKDLHP